MCYLFTYLFIYVFKKKKYTTLETRDGRRKCWFDCIRDRTPFRCALERFEANHARRKDFAHLDRRRGRNDPFSRRCENERVAYFW